MSSATGRDESSKAADAEKKATGKRRVRISESCSTVVAAPESSARTAQEIDTSWWTAHEFAANKDSVKRQCRGHRLERRYSDCLTHAYETASRLNPAEDEEEEDGKNYSGGGKVVTPAWHESTVLPKPDQVSILFSTFTALPVVTVFFYFK